jgi:repressor LexA
MKAETATPLVPIPLLGYVAAGSPILAEEHIESYVDTDPNLLKVEKQYFWLTIQGDSMIDAGILNGDKVLVESSAEAKDGQIVIALTDAGVTCKRLKRNSGGFYLKAENKNYPNIDPSSPWFIQGIVVSLKRDEF